MFCWGRMPEKQEMTVEEILKGKVSFWKFSKLLDANLSGSRASATKADPEAGRIRQGDEGRERTARKVRNWLHDRNLPQNREELFKICFALGLDEKSADVVLGIAAGKRNPLPQCQGAGSMHTPSETGWTIRRRPRARRGWGSDMTFRNGFVRQGGGHGIFVPILPAEEREPGTLRSRIRQDKKRGGSDRPFLRSTEKNSGYSTGRHTGSSARCWSPFSAPRRGMGCSRMSRITVLKKLLSSI